MRKILFYINTIHFGGAERVMVQLTRRFAGNGYEAVLVTSYPEEKEYTVPEGVKRICLENEKLSQSKIKRNITRIRKLRQICKAEKPHAVISFMMEPNFRSLLATMFFPVKRIVSVRNDPNREYAGTLGRLVGKLLLPVADGCVFQTEDAMEWFPRKLQKKSQIIPNEVAEEFFKETKKDGKDIIAVGRLSEQKNHPLLIRAFSKIAEEYPDEKLRIYGEGVLRTSLQELIDSLGLTDRILLMGTTADVPQVLAEGKIFVLSSDYEGMPNCLMEALAVGIPSISTDCPCGGPKMLIQNGENGLLVPVGDEDALVDALRALLSDPGYAQRIGQNGKISAAAFQPEQVFSQWKEFVEKTLITE